jgi:predicted nucleic acid-binding protein
MGAIEELRQVLAGLRLVLLDTMVFSYHFTNHPRYAALTTVLLEQIEAHALDGLTTTVTLAEVLTAPAQVGDEETMYDYELFLTHFPNLHIVPLDLVLARETARVRAETRLRFPDAAQVAAGRLAGADALVTNDRRWQEQVTSPRVVLLGDYVS